MLRRPGNPMAPVSSKNSGDSSSHHPDVMPVCVLSRSCQVPAHLTRTSVSAICCGPNWTDAFVQGTVVHKGELVPHHDNDDDECSLKAVIQDVDCSGDAAAQESSIRVTLMGTMAKDFSRIIHVGDVVVASGFVVFTSAVVKEKLHPCTLLLSGPDTCIYVCPPEANSRVTNKQPVKKAQGNCSLQPIVNSVMSRKSSSEAAQTSLVPKTSKYTYSRLDQLKVGAIVNVFGVVVFFKQPHKSCGSDYSSFLKITDQSNCTIGCNIFLPKLEDHPKIFKTGDIIRMHRVKVVSYHGSLSLIKSHGFSALTFDGADGETVEPRTSSHNFHFDANDRRTVEELRAWSAQRGQVPKAAAVTLSTVQPRAYFDLTCQLLAKASMDSNCTLLRVWDGTRCPHVLLKVPVKPDTTEGPTVFSAERERVIADVLVYDNHVEAAAQLQLGDFLRIYNLRTIPGACRVQWPTAEQPPEPDHVAFHLHGGTAYGRGIRVLPENSPDVQELKRVLEAFIQDEEDTAMMEVWGTPPEAMDSEPVVTESVSERTCTHSVDLVTLSQVQRSDPGHIHHVRVQVKSYEPQRLFQSLKLFCDKCCTMQDVPDEDHVSAVFAEASRDSGRCSVPSWAVSGPVQFRSDSAGPSSLSLYFSEHLMSQGKNKQLMFLKGASLKQVKTLSERFLNLVPVRCVEGHMTPLDLSVPVLFRGRRTFYGCKKCSKPCVTEPKVEGVELVSEKLVAEALGVELLRFVLLLKLELHDSSGSVNVLLWRDSELFFDVSAADVATNQESQTHICQTMEFLCPAEGSKERPWLDLCLVSYEVKDDGGKNQTVYQICHSTLCKV